MKRWILRLLVLCLVLWGGWWWLATTAMVRGFNAAADGQSRGGWQLQSTNVTKAGFPFQLAAQVTGLSASSNAVAINLPKLDVSTPVYWPGFVTIDLPTQPIMIGDGKTKQALTVQNGQAGLELHPGTKLQLASMKLTSDAVSLASDLGIFFDADRVNAVATQTSENPKRYDVALNITDLTPGATIRQTLRLPADWPAAFEVLNITGDVTFDRPWDRTTTTGRKPQPTKIALPQASAHWGAVQINASGNLDVDPTGIPSGKMVLGLQNWEVLVDLLVQNGLMDRKMSRQLDFAVKLVARPSAQAGGIEMDITFKNGRMAFGPIDLGPAPRIVLP